LVFTAIEKRGIMWEDPIVEEVHSIREQLLARFGGDFQKYCEYVRTLPSPSGIEPVKAALPNTATTNPPDSAKAG
jgi:hypothetical protein